MANIVANGGFETGSLPPWITVSSNIGVTITSPHSGIDSLELGTVGSIGTVTQTLTTVNGGAYQLSYWVLRQGADDINNYFSVAWNGTEIPGSVITNPPVGIYVNYTFSVTATSISTNLTFNARDDPSFFHLDDVSVTPLSGPCFAGTTKIHVKNIENNEIKNINANELLADIHQVYSINDQKFIPVKYNIVSGPNTAFMLIQKNALGENQPSEDFYITGGHPIIIDGIEIEAQKIPQATQVDMSPALVYTICTEKREPIMINGLAVLTWSYDEWSQTSKENNFIWHDNKGSH